MITKGLGIALLGVGGFLTGRAYGQAEMHLVGRIGDVSSTVNRVADRGIGIATRSANDLGQFTASVWRADAGFTSIPFLPGTSFVGPAGVSPSLQHVGTTHDGGGTNRPGYWSASTGLVEVPLPDPSPGLPRGVITDISADGLATGFAWIEGVAGSAGGRFMPMTYSPAAGRTDVVMPTDVRSARANRISRDGSVVSGICSTFEDELFPWRWTEAGGVEIDRTFPQRQPDAFYSIGDSTDDGSRFFGDVQITIDGDPFDTGFVRPFVWEFGIGMTMLGDPDEFQDDPAGSILETEWVSGDGERVVALGGDNITVPYNTSYIYDGLDSTPERASAFFERHGVDLTGWTDFEAQTISRDGTTFAGDGFLNGDAYIWMIFIPPVCPADMNRDGSLTPADLSSWIMAYTTDDIDADQNLDGLVTTFDFNAWIINFNAGC